jgi:hypothetical protein
MTRWCVVIAGQSNAYGVNGLPNETAGNPGVRQGQGEPEEPDERIRMVFFGQDIDGNKVRVLYGNDVPSEGFTAAAQQQQPLMRAHCPVQTNRTAMFNNSVTFGFHFAKQVVNDPSFPIGDEVIIVNSSFPGTGFAPNQPCGACNGTVTGCTFDTFASECLSVNWDPSINAEINGYDEAVSVMNNVIDNHGAKPLCMLWLQGEHDTFRGQPYQEALYRMFTKFREQFPTRRQEPLLVIIARMAPALRGTPADLTHQLAATELPNVGVITPIGETIDSIHYTADSHRDMGVQMLAKFKTLSSPMFESLPEEAPSRPTNVFAQVTPSGSSTISVSYEQPLDQGSEPVIRYTGVSSPDNVVREFVVPANGELQPMQFTDLRRGQQYTFELTASNSVGPSSPATSYIIQIDGGGDDGTDLKALWITLGLLIFAGLAAFTAHSASRARRKQQQILRGRLLSDQ